ncbi:zinc-binding alcohol dehydrogenase family protein [Algoriphagus sp.]|uniref:zinc-binding alcohol dehydrogenase family protein n=1 Tax=Algoriphagus sp. TaxID=1872435 RepID=UPI0027217CE0|nr:zinc-binding alcohol dehydrogenase family protein [Algoriphagus sp.]MDO8966031.1 zinc-binding alcohol dehydrogenase family protein [Algoriphagus sp.]MDP3198557.1 zinc-binding alcohol dehydrogenase family protein [Algoriphagus sp.]
MKALFLTEVGKSEVREIEKPVPKPNEVLLKVEMVGFCGGDMNGFKGLFPLQEYPNILGHEVGALIEELGGDVPQQFRIGSKVTLYPYLACGTCVACRKGRPNACKTNKTMGVRRPGAMTRYVCAPWQDLFPSDKLSFRELALAEPLTVGFHAVARGRVSAEDCVAVLGCGIVGLGAVASAVNRNATVIAIDLDDSKLEIARKIGVAHTINPSKEDLHARLQEITTGDGPDVIIEAVGSPTTYQAAVEEVAFLGRVVCIGYAKAPVEFNTSLFVQKEIEILGSRNCVGRTDFPEVIAYLEAGKFPVDEVISKVISIDEGPETLKSWAENPQGIVKIMIDFDR